MVHGPAVYVKEGVSFSRDLYPEKLRILMILTGFISFTVLLRLPISIFLDAISFNIDEVLSINIMALLRRLAFLVGSLTFSVSLSLCLCHCLSWSYFINSFLLTLVFLLFLSYAYWKILIMLLSKSIRGVLFHRVAYDCSLLMGMVLVII